MIKNIQIYFLGLTITVVFLAACNGAPTQSEPGFKDAWIRALPTGARMTAGFGTLTNPGREPMEITAFASPSFGDVSLHKTEIVDGISKMREVRNMVIDPDSSLVLEPGSYHLMLMMPGAEIQAGQFITLGLTLADGRQFSFQVPVDKR